MRGYLFLLCTCLLLATCGKMEQAAHDAMEVRATRIFAGPGQFPPEAFAAYGIVAFPAKPTADNRDRYMMICEAYWSGLPATNDPAVGVPISQQMVTVWPVGTDVQSDSVNDMMDSEDACNLAVDQYGQVAGRQALLDARATGLRLNGRGPYLIAWSPGNVKGAEDAIVLVLDMSDVTTSESASRMFSDWADDIERDPSLWSNGWDVAKVRVKIRLWADRWGGMIMDVIGGGG